MDPKQWNTKHTSIQGMPGPSDLRRIFNHRGKEIAME